MVDNRNYFWTQQDKDQGAVVFVGDSLTGNWKREQMEEFFPGMKIANRGIGRDGSKGVLFRLKENVLDLNPKAIVLCIGSNDLSAHANPADIESNIADILAAIRKHNADVPVVLCNIAPRDSAEAPTMPGAQADTNVRIAKLAEAKEHVQFLDLFKTLADADGNPVPEYFVEDRLHLAAPGYVKWSEALHPLLKKLELE